MQPTIGGTNSWTMHCIRQVMLRLQAQHSTQKEDQPSLKVPSSTRENERQSGNRACDAGSFLQAVPMSAVALFPVVFQIC